jgi:hypothetical protein
MVRMLVVAVGCHLHSPAAKQTSCREQACIDLYNLLMFLVTLLWEFAPCQSLVQQALHHLTMLLSSLEVSAIYKCISGSAVWRPSGKQGKHHRY